MQHCELILQENIISAALEESKFFPVQVLIDFDSARAADYCALLQVCARIPQRQIVQTDTSAVQTSGEKLSALQRCAKLRPFLCEAPETNWGSVAVQLPVRRKIVDAGQEPGDMQFNTPKTLA